MTDYSKLAAQLAVVRRAWKRKTALAGFAVVLLETLAIFTLVLLVDWLYQPTPVFRIGIGAVAAAAILALLVRHVVAPLVRRIPDEQVALYIEEHREDFQGALMTAAEFGRKPGAPPEQAAMIAVAVDAAAARASSLNLPRLVHLARLRKYGWVAALLVVAYAGTCLLFPQSVGHHATRVLAPWRPTPEDLAAIEARSRASRPGEETLKQPIAFTLSKGDVRVPRGGEFVLEAVLSRPPEGPVVVRFRPAAEGTKTEWRELAMGGIDKLNGFSAALRDINEDLQFCVASGPDASEPHRITVYNALAVESLQITTKFPAYLKLADRVDTGQAGDVAAPLGSTVTVRVQANNPLVEGALRWEKGDPQALRVEEPKTAAAASFEVKEDASYTFTVKDADGQEAATTVPSLVRALPDQPPKIEVKLPGIDIATHPLGQVTVVGEAADDFGVEAVDFVYQVAAETPMPEVRVPMTFKQAPADGGVGRVAGASYVLSLKNSSPRFAPGTLITYYLEARDQKGQKSVTDMYSVTVGYFEQWATWLIEPPEEGAPEPEALPVILAATWHIHTQKDRLAAEEFNKLVDAVATLMVDPATQAVYPYVNFKKIPPEKLELAKRVPPLAKKAHAALVQHDTAAALVPLRAGVAILTALGLTDSPIVLAQGGGAAGAKPDSALAQVTFLEQAKAAGQMPPTGPMPTERPGEAYRRELKKAEEAEKIQKKAAELQKTQQDIMDRANAAEKPEGGDKPAEPKGGEPKAGEPKAGEKKDGADKGAKPATPEALAGEQQKAGEQAKALAMDAKGLGKVDPGFEKMADKVNNAASDMFGAAGKLRQGDTKEAVIDMKRAQQNLVEAVKSVQGMKWQSLEQGLDLAQVHAEQILREQVEVRARTRAIADKLPADAKPDVGQQRDLKGLAYRQGQNRVGMERLKTEIGTLREMAAHGARPETAKGIDEANRSIERTQVAQKMTNAAVELDALRAPTAAEEAAKAEAGLQTALDKLREAAGTLASDYKSELVRAKHEADRIAGALADLSAKPEAKDASLNAQERTELGQRAAGDLARLNRHLESRKLVPDEAGQLKRVAPDDPNTLAKVLAADEALAQQLLGAVRSVGVRLAAELEARLQAERLKDFQREECPPQYRPMVNKYYELLSQTVKE